tara:strand:+ start:9684 stop:11384 length:1701 start_codon:yes stop_codon:yes gene_type:complete
MIILGIHDGHNCGASLLRNGEIIASVSEERLNRKKNEVGYPKNSIDEVLKLANLDPNQVDEFVYASNFMHNAKHLNDKKKWYKAGYVEQELESNKTDEYLKAIYDLRYNERVKVLEKHLKVNKRKIFFVEHHLAHAAAAYFGSNIDRKNKILILTCDGAGDGVSATVSIGYKNKIKRLSSTKRNASIGKIYSRVTHFLGFEPWEHEYKVMGMAPYGNLNYAQKIEKIFEKISKIKNNSDIFFSNTSSLDASYLFNYFEKNLSLNRFDNICLGVQTFLENQLVKWVKNCIKKTKINTLVLGGGVFMNVKANQKIMTLNEVKKLFVFPSCGDESLSMGAAWLRYYKKRKTEFKPKFNNIYLGRDYNDYDISKILSKSLKNKKKYHYKKINKIETKIASLLAENKIVARFSSKSEWGARALGNRSILANPSSLENIEKINSMIKKRDFWMPFSPSILEEDIKKYFVNKKIVDLRFMTLSLDSLLNTKIPAGLHPRDKTGRVQIVSNELNLKYYKLIKEFKKKTGISAVLNTSFNIHGKPIVYSPKDAIIAFKNSGLEYLVINNFMIKKI